MTTQNTDQLDDIPEEEVPVPVEEQKPMAMMFSNRTYDLLKYIAQIVLPAVATLYFGLASVWNLPKAGEVVGTISVIDTFLGSVLLLSQRTYDKSDAKYDGLVQVESISEGNPKMSMMLDATPEELVEKKDISFKVVKK